MRPLPVDIMKDRRRASLSLVKQHILTSISSVLAVVKVDTGGDINTVFKVFTLYL